MNGKSVYHGCCVSLNLFRQSTGHGQSQAPKIYSISHKNAHMKNTPQSKEEKTQQCHLDRSMDKLTGGLTQS